MSFNNMGNCKKCGKLFSKNEGSILCESCSQDDERIYKDVREYIYNNPGISVFELSRKLNINVSKIRRYIEEGRFNTV